MSTPGRFKGKERRYPRSTHPLRRMDSRPPVKQVTGLPYPLHSATRVENRPFHYVHFVNTEGRSDISMVAPPPAPELRYIGFPNNTAAPLEEACCNLYRCRDPQDNQRAYSSRVPMCHSRCQPAAHNPAPGFSEQQSHSGGTHHHSWHEGSQCTEEYSYKEYAKVHPETACVTLVPQNIVSHPLISADAQWGNGIEYYSRRNVKSGRRCCESCDHNMNRFVSLAFPYVINEHSCRMNVPRDLSSPTTTCKPAAYSEERNTCSPDCIDCAKVYASIIDRLQEMVDETDGCNIKQ